ncbi:MAG TPA: hypothetical protein VLH41_01180 [Thermoanaerobaculia bacterium]|nr:hypothetical protein [Thermoanaerobaculia bacterium]
MFSMRSGRPDAAAAIAAVAAGTAAIAWPLVWNGFPLVFWDTSEYLFRWADLVPGFDHPLFYSLWLGAFHPVPLGLFAAALAQALVTTLLLLGLCQTFVPGRRAPLVTVFLALLVAASPSAFHAVTLMPDVSALWIGLALPLLALAPSRGLAAGAAAVVAVSMTWHSANLPLVVLAVPAVLLSAREAGPGMGRAGLLLMAALAVYVGAQSWNASRAGLGFLPETGGTIVLANRLHESGTLAAALETQAERETEPKRREAYLAAARQEREFAGVLEPFLWSERSPLIRAYPGWRDELTAYRNASAFFRPVVLPGLAANPSAFLRTGWRNVLFMARGENLLGDFVVHPPGSGVDRVLEARWGEDRARFRASRQGRGDLPARKLFRFARIWKTVAPILSTLAVGAALSLVAMTVLRPRGKRAPAPAVFAAALLGLVFVLDLLVCGFLSGPSARYGERVIALPLVASALFAVGSRARSFR